jgi:hypothetical protein
MKLFADFRRTDAATLQYGETQFNFLSRCALPEYDRIRAKLDEWFSTYPASGKDELADRFRGIDRIAHSSAFFELLLHQFLLQLGCTIELHPELGHTTKRPDFLVDDGNGSRFVLEATIADDGKQAMADARRDYLLKQINDLLQDRNFLIGMHLRENIPPQQPSTRKIVAFLKQRLGGLDPNKVEPVAGNGFMQRILWHYAHDGLNIDFFPMPRPEKRRLTNPADQIGLRVESIYGRDDVGTLYASLQHKAKYYGEFNLPFVIAINNIFDSMDWLDVYLALYGTDEPEALVQSVNAHGIVPPRVTRGLFAGPDGPRCQNVSAVVHFNGIFPWSLGMVTGRLYHHPWAARTSPSCLNRLTRFVRSGESLELVMGADLWTVLRLPARWPIEHRQPT